MITVPHGEILAAELGGEQSGLTVKIVPERGHVFMMEERQAFAGWIEALVEKTEAMKGS